MWFWGLGKLHLSLSLSSLTCLLVWFCRGVCWRGSVVAGGDWGRERYRLLPKTRSMKQVGGEASTDVVLWGHLLVWFCGGICQHGSVVAGGDWGREREGSVADA